MPSRFPAKPLILLPCIIYCASCAPLQKPCVPCSLSCDGAPELKEHESVHVLVENLSETVHEEIQNVSSLFKEEGRCSVPGCFQGDIQYTLKMYADNKPVPEVLVDKTGLKPDCDPDAVSDRRNGADGTLCNTLLILLAVLLSDLLPP